MHTRSLSIAALLATSIIAGTVTVLAEQPVAPASDPVAPGCEPAVAPVLNEGYTPVEQQRGGPFRLPIRSWGKEATASDAREAGLTALEPTELFGRTLRYRTLRSGLASYYGLAPLSDTDASEEFFEPGGIQVIETPATGRDLADRAIAAIGDQGTLVQVGDVMAAMNHGTEIATGLRPYHLYWTDRGSDWSLAAGMDDPAQVIDVARSLACQ